jgi:hypothetical protein
MLRFPSVLSIFRLTSIVAGLGSTVLLAIALHAGDGPTVEMDKGIVVAKRVDDAAKPVNPDLDRAIELAKSARDSAAKLGSYTVQLHKREWIGRRLLSQSMELKFRRIPYSVYLRYIEPNAGREVLFVQGENGGKLLVHEGGFRSIAGTFQFDPNAREVMAENHYPVTELGIEKLAAAIVAQWELEAKIGDTAVSIRENVKFAGMNCLMITTQHSKPHKQFRFKKTCLYIDQNTDLPVAVQQYAFPSAANAEAPLYEEYVYTNLNKAVQLQAADFDRRNRQYRF